jgi:hypothetical protein
VGKKECGKKRVWEKKSVSEKCVLKKREGESGEKESEKEKKKCGCEERKVEKSKVSV